MRFCFQYDYENAPVLLWLQGGPGFSSLFGLFNEVGPFSVAEDNVTLVMNPYSWHKNHSLVFIDNPVGTGTSQSEDKVLNFDSAAIITDVLRQFTKQKLLNSTLRRDVNIKGLQMSSRYSAAEAHENVSHVSCWHGNITSQPTACNILSQTNIFIAYSL
jgi:carboxypeptidase C (cathepsin A)